MRYSALHHFMTMSVYRRFAIIRFFSAKCAQFSVALVHISLLCQLFTALLWFYCRFDAGDYASRLHSLLSLECFSVLHVMAPQQPPTIWSSSILMDDFNVSAFNIILSWVFSQVATAQALIIKHISFISSRRYYYQFRLYYRTYTDFITTYFLHIFLIILRAFSGNTSHTLWRSDCYDILIRDSFISASLGLYAGIKILLALFTDTNCRRAILRCHNSHWLTNTLLIFSHQHAAPYRSLA